MVKPIVQQLIKHQELILYVFFGAATTAVNFAAYGILERLFNCNYLFSNTAAWILSVVFAYITNRKYVFLSGEKTFKGVIREFLSFVSCRFLSGGFDMGAMVIFISIVGLNDYTAKIITNVGIVIINYVFSKLVIFRKKVRPL